MNLSRKCPGRPPFLGEPYLPSLREAPHIINGKKPDDLMQLLLDYVPLSIMNFIMDYVDILETTLIQSQRTPDD